MVGTARGLPALPPVTKDGPVDALVAGCHDLQVEVALHMLSAVGARQPADAVDCRRQLTELGSCESRYAVGDDLWHRSAAQRDNRRAAGHRLDHDQAERLFPLDREHQAVRGRHELALLLRVGLTDVLDVRAQPRPDLRIEVLLLQLLVDLGRQHDPAAGSSRRVDGQVDALLRVAPAEEQHVVVLVLAVRIAGYVDRVVHDTRPVQVRRLLTLRIRDRDQRDRHAEILVVLTDLAVYRTVGSDDRGSGPAPGGERTDRSVIMHDVDRLLVQEPGRPGHVKQLRHALADALGGRLLEGGQIATGYLAPRAGADQQHVMPATLETGNQIRHHRLDTAVSVRRHRVPGRGKHRDPQSVVVAHDLILPSGQRSRFHPADLLDRGTAKIEKVSFGGCRVRYSVVPPPTQLPYAPLPGSVAGEGQARDLANSPTGTSQTG